MNKIIECVPNISEGRRMEVIEAVADAVRSVPGVTLLDVSSDPDHNRTVLTFVGDPDAVAEGAFQVIAAAKERINLDEHTGEHPRIGATDVVPFVPVRNTNAEECAAVARKLGQRVGAELGVAVYLYGDAAARPEREKLAKIRRGQYEKWKEEVGVKPEREPDFGPAQPATWGATVIGARPFLIAYNLYLNSDAVDVADAISRRIRTSSGGLPNVQAKGFLVEGQAQVSMNLTNFEATPIHLVQELVKREAAQYGLTVTRAELIGMIPEKALLESAKYYLQLHDLADDQVLEIKMAQAAGAQSAEESRAAGPDQRLNDFLDAVGSSEPAPGGGSVAALAGALAAGLTQMVAGLTVGRKKYAEVAEQAQAILTRAATLRHELTAAIQEDADAFDAVMAAFRNKEIGPEARTQAIEAATIVAGNVPLRVATLARDAAGLAEEAAAMGNVNAVTDAASAAYMAQAAVMAAGLNVRVNAVGLTDEALAAAWRRQVDELEAEVSAIVARTAEKAAARGGF
ncbi:MAG: glutamate formimidoyltransferase [Caldilineaceae bacterium]|nr:glutamate formimidoyltransferase [Caldilineaceae bacterium]